MAKELTGCGKFLVWVAAPLAAGLIGYNCVGPNIGGTGLGERVPVIRSLGKELAKKVKGESEKDKPAPRSGKATPPPSSDGATEFQRLREEERKKDRSRRRAPVDAVE